MATQQTEPQATPGPWHTNAIHKRRIVGDASYIGQVDSLQVGNRNATVATVYRPADAALIAAAPEMLDTLRTLLAAEEWSTTSERLEPSEKASLLRDAIAKAEGR